MNAYYSRIHKELNDWHKKITKKENFSSKITAGVQAKTRNLIPRKVQDAITVAVKTLTQAIMSGSGAVSDFGDTRNLTLSESDYLVLKQFQTYKKTAVGEGAATGAGGFIAGLADLPALLAIKIKFLFDCAALYGFNAEDPNERLFILYIFQLSFSSHEYRLKCCEKLVGWDEKKPPEINWEAFQTEYRDYMDVAKLLQLVPVIGAPVGAIANGSLMETLCVNAMNAYRMRKVGAIRRKK